MAVMQSIIGQCHSPKLAKNVTVTKVTVTGILFQVKTLSKVYTGIGQILYFIKFIKDISGS